MLAHKDNLKTVDPEIFDAVVAEENREAHGLELIASENVVSRAVLEAQGSIMTNKYAEGYPGHRHYGGCECVDIAENLARDRAKKLFGAVYANVQPHSGSQANMGVYMAFLKPGDKVLGMNLSHGGHLTHGSPANFSGKLYQIISYGVRQDTETIDYNELKEIAVREKPKMIIAGASAYPRTLEFDKFREAADACGAYLMTDMAHIAGLVAAGLHQSPVMLSDVTTTTTHKTLRGPRGGMLLMGKDFENRLGIVAKKSGRVRMMSEVFDSNIFPGIQGGPLMHVIAAKAVMLKEALDPSFKDYQAQILKNCQVLLKSLQSHGFRIVSGGSDNHLMLVDLSNKNITGKEATVVLGKAGITVNENLIPFDKQPATVTSGIRIGTPAVTSRGLKEKEMEAIAGFIAEAIASPSDEKKLNGIREKVETLCNAFPLYR